MCGFPERLVIMNAGNVMITMFGAGDLVSNFVSHAQATYSELVILVDTPLDF